MKIKFLPLVVWTLACLAVGAAAQDKNFEISVELKETTLLTAGREIPAKVKLTNKADTELNTGQLAAGILFKLSKCEPKEKCAAAKQVYMGGMPLEAKRLKKGETLEFDVNLAALNWNDANAPLLDFSNTRTMIMIPAGEYFFFAEVNVFNEPAANRKKPRRAVFSDDIKVKLNPKAN